MKSKAKTLAPSVAFNLYQEEAVRANAEENARRENLYSREDRREYQRHWEKCLAPARATKRAIFQLLSDELKGGEELVDLLSGLGECTAPLLMAQNVGKLTLVDAADAYVRSVPEIGQRLKLGRDFEYRTVHFFRGGYADAEIPAARNATLIRTGFTLPPELSQRNDTPLRQYAGNQVEFFKKERGIRSSDDIALPDVLKALGTGPRVIRVFEHPKFGAKDALAATRAHVSRILEQFGNGWRTEGWQEDTKSEVLHGKLIHD